MDAKIMSCLCPCGNIDCLNVAPQSPADLGISERHLVQINQDAFNFSELHHMGIVILDPEHVASEVHKGHVFSIKCSKCGEEFLVIHTKHHCALAFRKELPVKLVKMRRGGRLLSFPGFPRSLCSFLCKAFLDPDAVRTAVSFEDFSRIVPSDDSCAEVISEDTDIDVMFNPQLQSCIIGGFEDVGVPSILTPDDEAHLV